MEIAFVVVAVSILAFMWVLLWRNILTLNCRQRAIEYIFHHGLTYKLYEQTSYDAMMWDFTKWKFEHFYPHYVERDEHEQF